MKEKILQGLDRGIEYSLYGILFFVPISKAGPEIFFSFAILFFIINKILKPDFKFFRSPIYLFLALFIGFSALSLINSGPYLKKSFITIFFKWSKYILLFIMTSQHLSTSKRIRNATLIFLFVSGLVAIDGLFQFFTGIDFLRHKPIIQTTEQLRAISASFPHYNDFGAYLIVPLSLISALLVSGKLKKGYNFAILILVIVLIPTFLLTYSRGSWLGFISAVMLMFILSPKPKGFILLFVISAIFVAIIPGIYERLLWALKGGVDNTGRFMLWKAAIDMIKENPFLGKGIGTFMDYCPKYAPNQYQYAHNCYLQIWAETGIFSLISFLGFLVFLLSSGIKTFLKNKSFLLLGLICGVFGFLVHSFLDTDLYSLQLSFLFWTIAGILFSLSQDKNKEKEGGLI